MIYVNDGRVKVEGKYRDLTMDYISLVYSLIHGDTFNKKDLEVLLEIATNVDLEYIDIEELKKQAKGEKND